MLKTPPSSVHYQMDVTIYQARKNCRIPRRVRSVRVDIAIDRLYDAVFEVNGPRPATKTKTIEEVSNKNARHAHSFDPRAAEWRPHGGSESHRPPIHGMERVRTASQQA